MTNVQEYHPPRKVYRHCEHCNIPFKLYHSEIARGKGLFHSKSCSAGYKYVTIYDLTCQRCGSPFRSINPDTPYCCINCDPEADLDSIIELLNETKQ